VLADGHANVDKSHSDEGIYRGSRARARETAGTSQVSYLGALTA
jgi:hypothetical protein